MGVCGAAQHAARSNRRQGKAQRCKGSERGLYVTAPRKSNTVLVVC